MPSSYDDIAFLYDSFWSDWYLPAAQAALEKLFFSCVPVGSRVLDVCCGSGHVTKELVRRGYQVTGVDNSIKLIDIARRNLPGVDFEVQNIEELKIEKEFDAALSTFDSMNHVLSLDGIRRAFARVHAHLAQGARFVFDMNLAEAYFLDLSQWQVTNTENLTGLVRGRFDPAEKKATTELICFSRRGDSENWARHRSSVEQRCYEQQEIIGALRDAGFESIETITALQAGMDVELGVGRIFLVAIR
jgi:SAM-dependent methyltransferase